MAHRNGIARFGPLGSLDYAGIFSGDLVQCFSSLLSFGGLLFMRLPACELRNMGQKKTYK